MKTQEFGKILRHLMDLKGYTAKDLCEATDVPKSTLSEYLNGAREPRLNGQLLKIARFLGVSLEYLLTGEEPEQAVIDEVAGNKSDGDFIQVHRGIYRITIDKFRGSGGDE